MIGHCCVSTDLPYLQRILDIGCSIGFDQIGLKHTQSDDSRLKMLLDLLAQGRARQVCLSQDHVCCIVGAPYERIPHFVEAMKDVRYSHLFRSFLPRARQAGVSEETIRLMLVENPRRLFESPARAASASVKESPRAKAA
jgi:phosphotriesterase-related protein